MSQIITMVWSVTLEPDILECEAKWALESITINKASGGDGLPVELISITAPKRVINKLFFFFNFSLLLLLVLLLSHVWLFATPWTITHQAPLSLELSRQEYWSRLPFPSPGIFPSQGPNLGHLHCHKIIYCWIIRDGLLLLSILFISFFLFY